MTRPEDIWVQSAREDVGRVCVDMDADCCFCGPEMMLVY